MWEMGANDWIRYGWGPYLKKEWVTGDRLRILYRDTPHTLSPIDAAKAVIKTITETYPAPYTLMCSGGVDSQVMIWAWHVSGIPFDIVSVKYVSDSVFFNEHDLVQLSEFSKIHNLPVRYINFDIIQFLENKLLSVSRQYDCDSPQLCTHIQMSENINKGTLLFSGNYVNGGTDIDYTQLGLHRYALSMDNVTKAVIPFFLAHDNRLATSFTPIIIENPSMSKEDIYKLAGFPVLLQLQKFNGFEKIKDYYNKDRDRIPPFLKIRHSTQKSRRVFDLLFRYPLYVGTGKSSVTADHLMINTL